MFESSTFAFDLNELLFLAARTGFWLDPNSYWAIARVVLGLGLVIFIHELGHFLVAKACGVKCDKFYVGFDAFDIKIGDRVIVPRSLLKWKWGETEYGIGILPLGGYVKMMGQDDNPANYQKEVERSKQTEGGITSEQAAMAQAGLIDRSKLDPRSFLAKSVSQRIAIISAGVTFNLISAIFFAAIAFKSGVNFTPAKIGSVIGGGPAWEHNLAGADVKKVGDRSTEGYFTWIDFAEQFFFTTAEGALPIEFVPYGQTEVKRSEVRPETGLSREFDDLAMAGVMFRLKPEVGELDMPLKSIAHPPLQEGDKIVAINGIPIQTDVDLRMNLVRLNNQEVEFTIERKATSSSSSTDPGSPIRLQSRIQPNPVRNLGFSTNWLPVARIQQGSAAEKAGLKIGDEILKVNGDERGRLTDLNERLLIFAHQNQTVELEIRRANEIQTISIQPEHYLISSNVGANRLKSVDSLGVALPMGLKIDFVQSDSAAERAGLKQDDEIVSVRYLLTDEQRKNERYSGLRNDAIDLAAEKISWAEIDQNLQNLDLGTEIELLVKRDGDHQAIRLKTEATEGLYQDIRGISLAMLEDTYHSATWSNAFSHGFRQVGRDLKRVGTTLAKLLRGQISAKNLGGPGTIAVVATSEASQGNSRLLLFLAFLSANLAIVNLLPIPVLDGGHLLFLAYEGIFRRPVNERTQILLTYAGLAMILSLMLFVVVLDIGRISRMLM
jgi:regulator of sigma E protease